MLILLNGIAEKGARGDTTRTAAGGVGAMKFDTKAQAESVAKIETIQTGYTHYAVQTAYTKITGEAVPCWTIVLSKRRK